LETPAGKPTDAICLGTVVALMHRVGATTPGATQVTFSSNVLSGAVRDSAGTVRRASPQCVSQSPVEALRRQAVLADAAATVQMSLALLWKELTLGLCKVVETFTTDSRCVMLTSAVGEPAVPLEGRRLMILEQVLSGVGQKRIALDLGLAPSTVALNARMGLGSLGVTCRPSRAHPLLMLAAKLATVHDLRSTADLSFVETDAGIMRVLSIPRPDLPLRRTVPPAELAVVASLVEGVCYREIAKRRGTSTRTIANQITAVFRRLKVSGRSELLMKLFAACTPLAMPCG
jgi:DNA-binding NarL/FixJ family response regulator